MYFSTSTRSESYGVPNTLGPLTHLGVEQTDHLIGATDGGPLVGQSDRDFGRTTSDSALYIVDRSVEELSGTGA